MIVDLTEEAESELEAIADYIARDNPARAISFLGELRTACSKLADLPQAFPLLERYASRGIRRRVHGNYLIFYRIEAERVVVIHVLHGARDYAGLLFPS